MKEVYYIQRDQFDDEGHKTQFVSIHETLEGARNYFNDLVDGEKADYMLNRTGEPDTTKEAMSAAEVEEDRYDKPDGTECWHIWDPTGWDEVYVEIICAQLRA